MVEQFSGSPHDRDPSPATMINQYVAAIAKLYGGRQIVGCRSRDAPPLVSVELFGRLAVARPAPLSMEEAKKIIDHLRRTKSHNIDGTISYAIRLGS